MSIKYQALMQVIEVDSTTDTLTVSRSGEPDFVYTPSSNIFPNILALVADIRNQSPANMDVFYGDTINPGFENRVVFTSSGIPFTGFVGTVINNLLGQMGAVSSTRYRGVYTPQATWLPRHRANDGRWFEEQSETVFRGSIGVTGNLSGISYTARQARSFRWPVINAENAIKRANNGTEQDRDRCFESIVNGARTNMLQYEASGNVSIKGLYYIDDISEYQGQSATLPDAWGSGTPNATNFVFCSPDAPRIEGQSDERLDLYYNVGVRLTSAIAPDWDWSI